MACVAPVAWGAKPIRILNGKKEPVAAGYLRASDSPAAPAHGGRFIVRCSVIDQLLSVNRQPPALHKPLHHLAQPPAWPHDSDASDKLQQDAAIYGRCGELRAVHCSSYPFRWCPTMGIFSQCQWTWHNANPLGPQCLRHCSRAQKACAKLSQGKMDRCTARLTSNTLACVLRKAGKKVTG